MLGSIAGLASLIALGALALLVLLHGLNEPWLKRRIQRIARSSAGVEIDYRFARIDVFSGAEIEGLVVHSPGSVARYAPDLVRVGRVRARWSWASILLGRAPAVGRLEVSDVSLTVVIDEHGRTSFDAISPSSPPKAAGAPVPVSRLASTFLGAAPPVGQLDIDGVTLALIRTEPGAVSDRTDLGGISMTLAASSAEPAARGWRVQAALGSSASPLLLALSRTFGAGRTQGARAKLWFTVDASPSALKAAIDLRMIEQTFAGNLTPGHWVHAEANVRFEPAAGRTEVLLDHAEAGDGAATAEGSLEVNDAGDAIVRHARGDVDLARLIRWLPDGFIPIAAERARVRCEVDSLVLGPIVRLLEGGTVAVDADLSHVAIGAPTGPLEIVGGAISARAHPAEGKPIAASGSVRLVGTRLFLGTDPLAADGLRVDFEGLQEKDGAVAGRVEVRFSGIERGGASPVVARDGHTELRVKGLYPDLASPLATRGDLALSIDLGSLDVRVPGSRAIAEGLTLHAHSALDGHAPYAVEALASASRVRVAGRDGILLADAPVRIDCRASDVQPDASNPMARLGTLHADVHVGEIHAALDTSEKADAIDFAFELTAATLRAVRPWLPTPLTHDAPWDRMAVSVRSRGQVAIPGEGGLLIGQTTEVDVERPAFGKLSARSLSLRLRSRGTTLRQKADLDLRVQGLALDGSSPTDDHLSLSASFDRQRPALTFRLATEGRAATKISGSLSFDRARRAIPYEIEAQLAALAPLSPWAAKVHGLDGLDLSELEIGLTARGALLGLVSGVAPDGTVTIEPSPEHSAAIEGKTDIRLAHVRWTKRDAAVVTPALTWHGDFRTTGPRRTLDSRIDIGTLHLDLGTRDVDLNGIDDATHIAIVGSLVDPDIEVTEHLSVRAVEQTVVPEYPLSDFVFDLSAERSPEGVVHISAMKVANGLGGTALSVTGNVDLGEGRRTLSLNTSMTQDLAPLSTVPERFKGRGRVAVDASVTSPDLAHYEVRAAVKGEDVTVALSRAGIDVDAANGEVPITMTLAVGANGIALQRSEKQSGYSMLRFADQHPLLSRSGFLSIAHIKTPFVTIAPLVGNLEVEQNVVFLRQFEMGVRGGTITGQCGLDWEGPKSTLELHVRASGVQSSHGEPFDGNIAVAVSAADRTIDGRAEILRIGERHLLDLLDLQDPLHVDPAMNRIRTALVFGYPESLRLVFDHGFASAHLELGGLARLVSIGELRGIPMGPIVDKMLAPMLVGPDTKETP
ncbi:MAG: hypothetical protein ABSC94_05560 [Polyangiaceae bacterium]